MTKFTPGPWTAEGCRVVSDALSVAVCIAWDRNDTPLLAAAPDLYQALPTEPHPGGKLLRVVAHYEDGSTQTIMGDVISRARAKAEGK